jgi:YfiH family protein
VIQENKVFGWIMHRGRGTFFFGSRHATRDWLASQFPLYRFSFLKQVHGHAVVSADPAQTLPADAHFTSEPGLALVSQTADCTPILLAGERTVCAIHAGWRGMAQNIVDRVHHTLPEFQPRVAAIGPHILGPSFEIGRDVALQLSAASPGGRNHARAHEDPQKAFYDLVELAREQLCHSFGRQLNIVECLYDTRTNPDLHSYRRGKTGGERQYSFVVLNP